MCVCQYLREEKGKIELELEDKNVSSDQDTNTKSINVKMVVKCKKKSLIIKKLIQGDHKNTSCFKVVIKSKFKGQKLYLL